MTELVHPHPRYERIPFAKQTLLEALHHPGARVSVKPVPVPNPAAGADFSQTVPGGAIWVPLSAYCELVTSANAANRIPRFVYNDGNEDICRISQNTAQAASLTFSYSLIPGAFTPVQVAGSVSCLLPLPEIPLLGGSKISSSTVLIDVADQWQKITLYVIQYLPPKLD